MKNAFLSAVALSTIVLMAGCGSTYSLGDVSNVRLASDLAVACKTNDALAAAERAQGGGGLGAALAGLERIVILRDVGRNQEASALLAERNKRVQASAADAAKTEADINKSVEALRDDRLKKSGKRTCS